MSHVKRLLGLAVFASTLWCAGGPAAFAELKIDITRGYVEPMPIAVSRFVGVGAEQALGADVGRVIASDLERSGLFRSSARPTGASRSPSSSGTCSPNSRWSA